MSLAAWVAVGLLGGIAAVARFVIDHEIAARAGGSFPLGILAVNLSGAVVLGALAGAALDGTAFVVIAGGGIGSFTTFSTWILDSHLLRSAGQTHLALLNLGGSLLSGFAAVAVGHWLGSVL